MLAVVMNMPTFGVTTRRQLIFIPDDMFAFGAVHLVHSLAGKKPTRVFLFIVRIALNSHLSFESDKMSSIVFVLPQCYQYFRYC